MPGEVEPASVGPVPPTDRTPPEGYDSEVQLAEHHFPPPTYRPRRFSAYPTPPDSIQEYGIELSPPTTPQVSIKASKAPQSIPWGRQAANARSSTGRKPDDATGPPAPSIKWQTSRDRVSTASARPASNKAVEASLSTTTRTPDSALPPSLRTQPSSAQTAPFDLHEFPLPPIPIVTADPQSAPPVLGTDRDRRRASTLYEPRESAYARRSFVQGGSWQTPPPSGGRRKPQPRRAATAPMNGFEALRLARKGSHLDIPLSAMGGGNLDWRRREMQPQPTS